MDKNHSPKILILGGSYLHNKVVEAARSMGLYTIVTDNIPDSPAKKIADKAFDINVSDVESVVQMCKEERVDAVISVCLDFCQTYYQQICNRLGLFCWGTREQFKILTQKDLFKKACAECGVDTIISYDEIDIIEDNDTVDYPLMIKPSQNRGSRGTTICNNRSEALQALTRAKALSQNGRVIIEKYIEGKNDFQVTLLVADGIPYVVRTADRYLGPRAQNMDRVAIALSSPSRFTDLFFANVYHKITDFINYLDIKNAPIFFQGFVDNDRIYFYDPGMRFPGGEYDRYFSEIVGVDLMEMLIYLSLYGDYGKYMEKLGKKACYLNGNCIFTLHSVIKSGRITHMVSEEKLTAIEGVRRVSFRHHVGDMIQMTCDVNQRFAETNIVGTDTKDIIQSINSVQNCIEVLDEKGENMVFCKFNPEILRSV